MLGVNRPTGSSSFSTSPGAGKAKGLGKKKGKKGGTTTTEEEDEANNWSMEGEPEVKTEPRHLQTFSLRSLKKEPKREQR